MARKLTGGLLGAAYEHRAKDILSQRFVIPPFSVLNTREGSWQERKRMWINLGIRSELGRGYEEDSMSYTCGKPGDLTARYGKPQRRVVPGGGGANSVMHMRGAGGDGRKQKKFMIEGAGGQPLSNYYKQRARGVVAPGRSQSANHMDDIDNYRNRKQELIADKMGESTEPIGGTSVFDPVLCELNYRWFCPPGGLVLDPFAGGSVRGIVAGELGLTYFGIELSARQVAANEEQAKAIGTDPVPTWLQGDSVGCQDLIDAPGGFDYLFSCPPYGNLEVYSDDPADLSALPDADFDDKYALIIQRACGMLKDGAFATFVVGDYRDKRGFYRNLPGVTIDAFQGFGLQLYNTAILVNVTGSLPLRIQNQFNGSRKLGTCHQTALTFCKGQPKDFVKAWPAWELP